MIQYNALVVNYENSLQLRLYDFPIVSDKSPLKKDSFEVVENEIDSSISSYDDKYHFEGHSAYVSLNRSKNNIFYLARSNDWTNGYFCTLTIDPKRFDCFDYKNVSSYIQTFLKRIRNFSNSAYALFVPEKHRSGAFHFHGLISGIDLERYDIISFSGHYFKDQKIYNFVKWWDFGFSNVTRVQSSLAVEKYVTKYTTKELLNDTKYQHRYFTLNLHQADFLRLNFYSNKSVLDDLIQMGYVSFCNTDGLYNRVTYLELKKDKNILHYLQDCSNLDLSKDLNSPKNSENPYFANN